MLLRYRGAFDDAPTYSSISAVETIVHRSTAGRLYTIEVSPNSGESDSAYGARVVQMAAMNRAIGECQGVSREDVVRKACALIDAAMGHAVPSAA